MNRDNSLVRHYHAALTPSLQEVVADYGFTPEPTDGRSLIVTTLAALLVQGGPGFDAASGSCTYADLHGRHCAVGVWMTPQLARDATPAESVSSVAHAYGWEKVFGFEPGRGMQSLAITLQAMHDTAAVSTIVEWYSTLRAEFMARAVLLMENIEDRAATRDEALAWAENVWADAERAALAIAAEVHP